MDFKSIEDLVGFNIPVSYKKVIQNYPPYFKELCSNDGYEGESMLLYDSLTGIYKANETVRAHKYRFEPSVESESEWPKYHLVIGDSGCGDWYVLETLTGIVKFWDHETGGFTDRWETLLNCLDDHYRFFHEEDGT